MAEINRVIDACDLDDHLPREWLVTNGLGGCASRTV